jgi:hypothetical protein
MDVTLADYIKRALESLEKSFGKQNMTNKTEQNQYPVYPEPDNTDRPVNPYSQV